MGLGEPGKLSRLIHKAGNTATVQPTAALCPSPQCSPLDAFLVPPPPPHFGSEVFWNKETSHWEAGNAEFYLLSAPLKHAQSSMCWGCGWERSGRGGIRRALGPQRRFWKFCRNRVTLPAISSNVNQTSIFSGRSPPRGPGELVCPQQRAHRSA